MRMSIDRRAMIKTLGIGAAGLALSGFHEPTIPSMLQRIVPATGEKLPAVGLGSWLQFDVDDQSAAQSELTLVLKKLVQTGGKVIDSSPMYGRAEGVIGQLSTAAGVNESLFVATKVWTTGRQEGIDQMNDSFRKFKRKVIDLMQVHNLQDYSTHLRTLQEWKKQGKIRYIGATHYTDAAHGRLEEIVKSRAVDFVQFNYSINSRNAEKRLLRAAQEHGVAVLINEPFDQGALFRKVKGKDLPGWASDFGVKTWAQYFLKYILSDPAVTCVIPGTSDVKHLEDNLGAGFGKMPAATERKEYVTYLSKL